MSRRDSLTTPVLGAFASTVVLVAEDEALLRLMMSDTLTEAGFKVVEAASADEALRLFEQHKGTLRVLVTDVQMPGSLDGLALARHVAERWPKVGIVVCSGQVKVAPEDLPRGAHFVRKPWRANLLLATVQAVM